MLCTCKYAKKWTMLKVFKHLDVWVQKVKCDTCENRWTWIFSKEEEIIPM